VRRGALASVLSLSSRGHRRVAVVIVLTITAFLGALIPQSYHGLAIAVVLLLVALDIRLIRATGGLAFTRRTTLDERETGLRDLAYRRGFRLLGLAVAVELVIIIATNIIVAATSAPTQFGGFSSSSQLSNVITGRGLTWIVELLVMAPTLTIAWVDGDHLEADDTQTSRRGALLWLTLPALAGAWLLVVSTSPEQEVKASPNNGGSYNVQGASCAHFVAGRMVGSEFGATVGMRVEVCWNGTDAFVFGDPSIPLPQAAIARMNLPAGTLAGVPPSFVDPALPFLTSCGADNVDDFATVSGMSCTASIDGAGTLYYTVFARVSALPGGTGQHDVSLHLVVARDGRVVERP
jgi:hypothetical protein